MMFRQLKVGERLQPFTGTTGQGQAAMLVIAVVDVVVMYPLFKTDGNVNGSVRVHLYDPYLN